MGGSKPSAPVHYRHKPTAPIIYQTIQSQEGWDAADDFLKILRSDRDAIVKDQAAVLGAKNQQLYADEKKKYQSAAVTADNPMWKSEQAARSKLLAADAAGDKAYVQAVTLEDQKKQAEQKSKSTEDSRRRAAQLASLAVQQGSGYEPPKPSGSK